MDRQVFFALPAADYQTGLRVQQKGGGVTGERPNNSRLFSLSMHGCLSFHCPSVPLASQDLVEFPQCKRVNLLLQTFPTAILGRSAEYWLTMEQRRPNHQSMEFSRLVGSLSLLQGIFPTQGLNPGFPHCRQILYQQSHKGSPRILKWVAYPFSSGSS